tara:strand:- start:730 stop:966 length:237 start_codon:yes stop_codon:yes gene_type:complete
MIPSSLITIQNAILLWNLYHYYVYADSIYKGVYYTTKVITISKNAVEYVFVNNKKEDHIKEYDYENKEESEDDEWVIL